ncbi:MAG: hypothetical protein K0S45_931 [Nitrospira sp.]|jgi:hypothetical protein|nr:hypothetical protein [Nitrospira sp.]
MDDSALWVRWYIWLLAFPALVVGALVRDWLEQWHLVRFRKRSR